MNKTGTVAFSTVHSTALAHAVSNKTLDEGSVVFVRVLKNNGGNAYTVSFAGGRFSIHSEIPLKEGASFPAKIKLENGKVLLVQQKTDDARTPLQGKGSSPFDQNGRILNDALASYLENLHLIPDETSYTLLNQMKLLGMKFDAQLAKKMRIAARNAKSGEKNAAETALILEKKGLAAVTETIEAITGCSEKADESDENEKHTFKNETGRIIAQSDTENSLEKSIKTALKKYIRALTSEEMYKNRTQHNETEQNDILSLFNHAGFDLKSPLFSGSWIKLPFEMKKMHSEKQKECTLAGFISFFLNPLKKSTEKCVVKVNYNEKKYTFSLSFKNGKCIKIRSNVAVEKLCKIPIENCDMQHIPEQHITDFNADDGNILLEEIQI